MVSQRSADPSAPPLPVEEARKALELPDVRLVPALVASDLVIRDGVILPADAPDTLAPVVRAALSTLESRSPGSPCPPRNSLRWDCVLPRSRPRSGPPAGPAGTRHRAAPSTLASAVSVLAALEQPFTAGAARDALGTSRKVIVPLLEHLAASAYPPPPPAPTRSLPALTPTHHGVRPIA
jgi:selenocysteine-specific elongation factor